MNRIIRMYNQNRREFWTAIIVIAFIILIIQTLNYLVKVNKENESSNTIDTTEKSYQEESKSIISGGNVSKSNMNQFGMLIEDFLNDCINGEVDKAYNALSTQCKEELYPTVEQFKNTYWMRNFSTKKTYKFQSWNSAKINTYLIKLYEDNLSTGDTGEGAYIEDYYTIIKEDGINKLNISNLVQIQEINRSQDMQGISITVEKVKIYKEYYTYQIKIKNQTQNDILLDTGESTETVYATNSAGVNFEALLYENSEEDFIIKANEEKTINIKFGIIFREDLQIASINFTDIITNYQQYLQEGSDKVEKTNIQIEI